MDSQASETACRPRVRAGGSVQPQLNATIERDCRDGGPRLGEGANPAGRPRSRTSAPTGHGSTTWGQVALDVMTVVADKTRQDRDPRLTARAHQVAELDILSAAAAAQVTTAWSATSDGWRLARIAVFPPPSGASR